MCSCILFSFFAFGVNIYYQNKYIFFQVKPFWSLMWHILFVVCLVSIQPNSLKLLYHYSQGQGEVCVIVFLFLTICESPFRRKNLFPKERIHCVYFNTYSTVQSITCLISLENSQCPAYHNVVDNQELAT